MAPPPAPARGHCFVGSDPLPADELTLPPVEIDFDPPPRIRRTRGVPRSCRDLDVDKLQIRRAVLAIHGDLRTCYLDALARQPALEGTVTAELSVGSSGGFERVVVTGAGDGVLHTCLADALGATGASSEPSGPILVNLPFALSRSSTSYDRETAARGFAERAGAAATADESCRARTALVRAYLGWDPAGAQPAGVTIDPRAMPALESLSEFVAANPGPALAGCLDDLSSLLVSLGRQPMRDDEPARLQAARGGGLAEAIERSQRIAELFPHVERSLLLFIADGLAMLDQHDAARDAYVRFLSLASGDRDAMERAADSFALVTRNRDDGIPWDDCPR